MKKTIPLLLSMFFFFVPLRLVAMMQEFHSNFSKNGSQSKRTTLIKGPANLSSVREDKEDEFTSEEEDSSQQLTVGDFQEFALANPRASSFILDEQGTLTVATLRALDIPQSKKNEIWGVFLAAIEKEYGATLVEAIEKGEFLAGFRVVRNDQQSKTTDYLAITPKKITEILNYANSKQSKEDDLAEATDLEGCERWSANFQINYDGLKNTYCKKPSSNPGLCSAVAAVLRRDRNEREQNRVTLTQIIKDLERQTNGRDISNSFKNRFRLRLILGQPLTAGAFYQWKQAWRKYNDPFSGAAVDFYRGLAKMWPRFSNTQHEPQNNPYLENNPHAIHTLTENSWLLYDSDNNRDQRRTAWFYPSWWHRLWLYTF